MSDKNIREIYIKYKKIFIILFWENYIKKYFYFILRELYIKIEKIFFILFRENYIL